MQVPLFLAISSLVLFHFAVFTESVDIPTLVPAVPFDSLADAKTLYDAIAGLGTNEAKIINVLCYRTSSQRAQISQSYFSLYGKTLESALKGDLSGLFRDLMVSLIYSMDDFLAIGLHKTLAIVGTDEASLMEVLISQSNAQIAAIKASYFKYYGVSLIADIESDTIGTAGSFFVLLAQGTRNENSTINATLVQEDVDNLYKAGMGQLGTDDTTFVNIFCLRSYNHLRAVFAAYQNQTGVTMETVIELEFSGAIRTLFLSLVQYAQNKDQYFAMRLYSTLAIVGTLDVDLMRMVISRCEVDLGNAKTAYVEAYGRTLASDVSSDTSGNYRTSLLALIG